MPLLIESPRVTIDDWLNPDFDHQRRAVEFDLDYKSKLPMCRVSAGNVNGGYVTATAVGATAGDAFTKALAKVRGISNQLET
jgi:hypothetical protein